MGVLFNGSQWVISTVNYVRASSDHSVSFWLRTDNQGVNQRPFGSTGAWEMRTNTGLVLTSDLLQSGTLGTVTLTDEVYHHLVVVQDVTGSNRYMYLDGALVNTVTSATFAAQQTGLMNIGVAPGGASQGWNGALDDLRVYDRVLTLEECQTIHACRGTDGLLPDSLWYRMDEGAEGSTVSTLYEFTENGPDCVTVTGTPAYNYDAGIKYRRVA